MSLYVVDASVAAQWFLSEPQSASAAYFRKKEHDLCVPRFFFLEIHNVLLKHIRRREISTRLADLIRRDLRQHPFLVHSDRTLLDGAYQVAHRSGCSLYDGLYLSLAVRLDCRMVTADRRFYNGLSLGPFSRHVLWVEDLG